MFEGMFQGSHPDQSSKVMELVGLKTESLPVDSTSSTALIPDAELEPFTQDDNVRTEERKGGRKPVCNIFFAAPPDAIIQALHCFSHTFSLPCDSLFPLCPCIGVTYQLFIPDMRHLRSTKALQQTEASFLSQTPHRAHSPTGENHQAQRGGLAESAAKIPQYVRRLSNAVV